MPHNVLKLKAGIDITVAATLPSEWCSETTLACSPLDPDHLLATTNRILDPEARRHSVSVLVSRDRGATWSAAALPALPQSASGPPPMTNPVVGFGAAGTAFLLSVVEGRAVVFRSPDGGATWSGPSIDLSWRPDDLSVGGFPFAWMACDPVRPGRLCIVSSGLFLPLSVACSEDDGKTWTRTPLGSLAVPPHVSIAHDGTIHVVGIGDAGNLMHWSSRLGPPKFTAQTVVGPLPITHQRPAGYAGPFPQGFARVSGCATSDGRFHVAWSEVREGVSRIRYRATAADGTTWDGPAAGTALLPAGAADGAAHHVQPHLAATGSDEVGCAFYELRQGETGSANLLFTAATDVEHGFATPVVVNDRAWVPVPRGSASAGDNVSTANYIGLAADPSAFLVLWPDTREGTQATYLDSIDVIAAAAGPIDVPHDPDVTMYITSASWITLRIRNGTIVVVRRFPPKGPVGLLLSALTWLGFGRRLPAADTARALARLRTGGR